MLVTPKTEQQPIKEEEEEDDNVQEPEAGLEPAGPDQSLPVSAEPNPRRRGKSRLTLM